MSGNHRIVAEAVHQSSGGKMAMDKKECNCVAKKAETACLTCGNEAPLLYWCETCQQLVPDKRCPNCGLKSRKARQPGQ